MKRKKLILIQKGIKRVVYLRNCKKIERSGKRVD